MQKYMETMYGTPKFKVEEMLDEGKKCILEIDIQGALKVKENLVKEYLYLYFLHQWKN